MLQKFAQRRHHFHQVKLLACFQQERSGVRWVGDELGLVDVYADTRNRGAYLGVDERVLKQDARNFVVGNIDIVGPFDGNWVTWQVVFHQIGNCQRDEDVELKLVFYRQKIRVEYETKVDVLVRFRLPFATNLPPAIGLAKGRNNRACRRFVFSQKR